MKNVVFNILTVITLLATVGVGVAYASIFFMTGGADFSAVSSLSFAPAPELPTQIVLPTSTETPHKMPPTWTATSRVPTYNPNATGTSESSSSSSEKTATFTATLTPTLYVIPSMTPSLTASSTHTAVWTSSSTSEPSDTPTKTKTRTPTLSKTPTADPDNKTLTALAVMEIKNTLTAQAMTLAVAQIYQTQTFQAQTITASARPGATATAQYLTGTAASEQTLAATPQSAAQTLTATHQALTATYSSLPTNPSEVTVSPEALQDLNGQWQNSSADVSFSWDAVSGADGYRIYWGTSSTGTTSTTWKATTSYPTSGSLTAPSEATYYLRLRTHFSNGMEASGFTTVYVMRYDGTAPTNPTSATESHGASSGTWQGNVTSPSFTATGGSDGGSGIRYYFAWMSDSSTPDDPSGDPSTSASYAPGTVSTDGTYYLWGRGQDVLGNRNSSWTKIFTFDLDTTAPSTPSISSLSVVPDTGVNGGTDSYNHDTPTFSWNAATDASSGIQNYDVYWGTDGSVSTLSGDDVPVTQTTSGTSYHASSMTLNVHYYLRIRARDKAGNTSDWSDTYSITYNNTD
jgi:hypothetical protein